MQKQTSEIQSTSFDGDFSFRPPRLRSLRQRNYKSTFFEIRLDLLGINALSGVSIDTIDG
jgi:hypothetical protein